MVNGIKANDTFSRLTALESLEHPKWLFQCACGRRKAINAYTVLRGTTNSCGCLKKGYSNHKTHGCYKTKEYNTWRSMRKRCLNPMDKDYPRYGGRGITICIQWDSFETFLHDMGLAPTTKHTIERLDTNGDYNPKNCHWATMSEQNRNRSITHKITFQGKTQCLCDWAQELGIDKYVLSKRLQVGWSEEKALTTPVRRKNV